MNIYRTRFARDIICEFAQPARKSPKAIILCGGLPSPLSKASALKFWAKKGYWTFYFRYRGTWESGGQFLRRSPAIDILDVARGLRRPFADLRTGKKFSFSPLLTCLVASSFGGSAALLASADKSIDKVVALSPVVDWREGALREPAGEHRRYIRNSFGPVYRFSRSDWQKLYAGKLINPIDAAGNLPGGKMLIMHAKDDDVVAWQPVKKFADLTGARIRVYKKGGHFGLSQSLKPLFFKAIQAFLKSK